MTIHLLNDSEFLENQISDEDLDLVKKHAHDGDALAQYHLAVLFDTGRGVAHNPREAEKWYKAAAAQGNADAQYFLARMYSLESSGVAKNEAEAVRLFKAAAEQGHQGAIAKVYN